MDYKRILIAIGIGAILLMGGFCYGDRHGQIKEILAENKIQSDIHDSITKSVTSAVDSAKKKVSVLDSSYDITRAKVHVVHDTIFLPSDIPGKVDTVTNQTLVKLIHTADSLKVAYKESSSKQDILIASLRVNISDRDKRITLLESQGVQHVSHGVQLGAGYCQSLTGGVPCVYVGYGVSFR